MAALVYASSADYTGLYPQATPQADIDTRLRFASRLVRRDTVAAIYAVNTDGSPSDPGIAEAFKEATCAQVYAWQQAGIDPAAGGLQQPGTLVASKSLDGGTVAYDNSLTASTTAMQERKAMIDDLVPEAVMILMDALGGAGRPWIYG